MERKGKGLLGEVYKVRDKRNNQIKAMKIIHKGNCVNIVENLIEKWEKLKSLSHANIASYYDIFQDNNCCYISLEYFIKRNCLGFAKEKILLTI